MPDVNVSSSEVKKLAAAIRAYESKVADATRAMSGAIRTAQWNDKKKDQFEARYREFERQVQRFLATETQDMVRSLNKLAAQIEAIERMRM